MKRLIFGNSLVLMMLIAGSVFGQLGFQPRSFTLGNIDLMGGGIWNWEQSLPQRWDNLLSNGDFAYWPNGASSIPYGMNATYSNVNCIASREDNLVKVGNYALRITANGVADGYCDYRLPIQEEYKGRYFTIGFWYFCAATNTNTSAVILGDGTGNNRSLTLHKDGNWHWAQLTIVPKFTASLIWIRFLVNYGGVSDGDDYIVIDGLTAMEGRVVTRWCMSYWDYLYKAGLIIDSNNHYGFGLNPDATYYNKFNHSIFVTGGAPVVVFDDTDYSNHEGMFRLGSDAQYFFIDKNLASGGDFSSYSRWFTYNEYGIGLNGAFASDSLSFITHGRAFADTLSIGEEEPTVPREGDTFIYEDVSGNLYLRVFYHNTWYQVQLTTVP